MSKQQNLYREYSLHRRQGGYVAVPASQHQKMLEAKLVDAKNVLGHAFYIAGRRGVKPNGVVMPTDGTLSSDTKGSPADTTTLSGMEEWRSKARDYAADPRNHGTVIIFNATNRYWELTDDIVNALHEATSIFGFHLKQAPAPAPVLHNAHVEAYQVSEGAAVTINKALSQREAPHGGLLSLLTRRLG